jgi:hypothetical protein
MSYIWNVMLSFSNEELWEDDEEEARETCEPLERINAWIPHGELVWVKGEEHEQFFLALLWPDTNEEPPPPE